jgi:hypothetical protein
LPDAIFDNNDDLIKWLSSIKKIEIDALFQNETIERSFISEILEKGNKIWDFLTEKNKILVLDALSKNKIICKKEDYLNDGYSAYDHNILFQNIWNLAKELPVTSDWAKSLGRLLKNAAPISNFDGFEISKRWINKNAKEKTNSLDEFDEIRFYIYRNCINDLKKEKDSNRIHIENADLAYRFAAYEKLPLTCEEIKAAFKKDGTYSIYRMIFNDNIWRSNNLRETLLGLCIDNDCFGIYKSREEYLSKKYPNLLLNHDEIDENSVLNYAIVKNLFEKLLNKQLLEIKSSFTDISKATKYIYYLIICFFIYFIFLKK